MAGTLLLVATPIGNLEDITLRALRVLREADLIAAEDTRRTAKLLAHFGIGTPTLSLHAHNERERTRVILDRLRQGQTVAVVSDAGMPLVSDPGATLLRETLAAGIRVEVVPGASALTMALAGAGLVEQRMTFAGFPPSKATERRRWLTELSRIPGGLVIFEAPHRLRQTLGDMLPTLGDREVVVAHELTKVHESWHRGLLSTVAEDQELPEKGEFTIVIGSARTPVPSPVQVPDTGQIWLEFGRLTNNDGRSRKEAIAELADRYGLPKRQVYSLVEAGKNSGK